MYCLVIYHVWRRFVCVVCIYVHSLAFMNVCTYETTALICSTYWDGTYCIRRNTMISCFCSLNHCGIWINYVYMCTYLFSCLLVSLSYIISHMISLNMKCCLFILLITEFCLLFLSSLSFFPLFLIIGRSR